MNEKIYRKGGGLDEWYTALNRVGISVSSNDVEENLKKEVLLDALGLPRSRTFGFVNNESEIKQLPKDLRFVARCVSLSDAKIARGVDLGRGDITDFISKLPGGFEVWSVEIKEFVIPLTAGIIIINGDKVLIETWAGPHYLNTETVTKFVAKRGFEAGVDKFNWSTNTGDKQVLEMPLQEEKIKRLALKAFELARSVTDKTRPRMYFEFFSDKKGKILFIEAQQSDILTQI